MSRPVRDPEASAKVLGYVKAHPGLIIGNVVARETGVGLTTVQSTLKREAARNPHLRRNDAGGRYGGYIYDGPAVPVEPPANGSLPAVGTLMLVRIAAHIGGAVLAVEEADESAPGPDCGRAWVLKVPARIEVD